MRENDRIAPGIICEDAPNVRQMLSVVSRI